MIVLLFVEACALLISALIHKDQQEQDLFFQIFHFHSGRQHQSLYK